VLFSQTQHGRRITVKYNDKKTSSNLETFFDFSILKALIYLSEKFMSTGQFDLSKLKIDREKENGGKTGHSSRTSYLLYGAGALFLILAAFFFIRNTFGDEEIVDITTVSMISPSQASALLTASGYVVAQTKASIASKATGRLVYLGFKEGDQVKKGEIIARIESGDVEAAVHQAKADLDVAIADKNSAEQTLRRTQELLNRQLASQADYDAAKAQYDRVIATIASREANLNSMQVSLENTNIRAPFDGTILTKNADIGEVVAPFGAGASSRVAVVTIADMGSLEVEADVSESNIEKVSTGQPCEISLDAYPEKNYRGVVDKIIPTADRAKATILTKIRFLERDNRVLPEMSAKVHFLNQQSAQSESTTPTLVTDPSTIATRDGKKVAFVLRGNSVSEVPVTTGTSLGRMIEITSGLQSGDKVVLNPSESLRSGSKVKLKQ